MHSIKDLVEKIKGSLGFRQLNLRVIPDDIFLGFVIILVAFGSFGLGRLSKIEGSKIPIRIENAPNVTADTFTPKTTEVPLNNNQNASIIGTTMDQLVGSKNGKKYYYPWCSGTQKISPANLIHFASKVDAESRGYTPSATCKGL